jgi:hypothetical protein
VTTRPAIRISVLLLAIFLTACGGGSLTAPAPTTATVSLATVAKSGQNPQVSGITVELLLPAGVTLRTVAASRQTADGVVSYSGNAAFSNLTSQLFPRPLFGSYSTGGSGRGAVTISFISPTPFGAGEFATLTCDVAAGATATASGFQILNFQATGDSATQFADDLTALFDTPIVTMAH